MEIAIQSALGIQVSNDMEARKFFYLTEAAYKKIADEQKEREKQNRAASRRH